MSTEYPAHIRVDDDGRKTVQSCNAHSRNTAKYAQKALEGIGLENTAYLSGLLHDMGKYKISFKEYIEAAADGRDPRRGSVIHTFAAVRWLMRRYHTEENEPNEKITCEIIAFAVGAHHGLFDCIGESHENGFVHRMKGADDDDQAIDNFLTICSPCDELDKLFAAAVEEITALTQACLNMTEEEPLREPYFLLGLAARLVASAVMEGDRRDTAEFMTDAVYAEQLTADKWRLLLCRMEQKLEKFSCDTPINAARRKISDICRAASEQKSGIYRLNVPTGGGKTLASLRYALSHAAKHGKKRIIFVSPLLSILDQNSAVIREYLEADELILEHHSNVVADDFAPDSRKQYELLQQFWNSPIIITTLVQLLGAMFDGKGGAVRRFNALSNAVIVIDEVQSVPGKMLSLFNMAISFLADICRSTVILCSATQPCDRKLNHPIRSAVGNIVPHDARLFEPFKRTELKNADSMRLDEIPCFAAEVLKKNDSLLIVCNKKDEAERIFYGLNGGEYAVFYLSAAMCMKHRRNTLNDIYASLNSKSRKTVCVSTQVIEAGIDISFGAVIRLCAGMDNIVQSAGRCNRNGEASTLGTVYIVNAKDENLQYLPEIQLAKQSAEQLLLRYKQNPSQYDNDIASHKAVEYYYNYLYTTQEALDKSYHDYPLKGSGTSLFSLLSNNEDLVGENTNEKEVFFFSQAFAVAGRAFTVFDNNTTDAIVPYGEGEGIICALLSERAKHDINYVKQCVNRAKGYTVSLYSYQKSILDKSNALISLNDGIMQGISAQFYSDTVGFSLKQNSEVNDICNIQIL